MNIYLCKCPCKGCKIREIGCHNTCDEYKEYQQSRLEVDGKGRFSSVDSEAKYKRISQYLKKGGKK